MAELSKNVLESGIVTISNPLEMQPIYTDDKERTVIDEMTMQLKPLAPAMRNALNRRGINADSMSFENLIMSFYNEFVTTKQSEKLAVTYLSEHPLSGVKVSNFDAVNHADVLVVGQAVVTGIKNLAANIRNKAKAKKAQKIANAGGYNTLTAFQKSLIAVPDYVNAAPLTKEENAIAADVDKAVVKLEEKEEKTLTTSEAKTKKIIIIAIVVIVLGVVVWFFMKKK